MKDDAGGVSAHERSVGRPTPERPSTCGLTECRNKPMCFRCERIEEQAAMSAMLPEGVSWGDHLTPDIVRELLSAERERCAKPVPDEWLVKVRRLAQGFEHVSGIARLWEPDYSSGSDRALWARATEACADVAKLLREYEGPNARVQPP